MDSGINRGNQGRADTGGVEYLISERNRKAGLVIGG